MMFAKIPDQIQTCTHSSIINPPSRSCMYVRRDLSCATNGEPVIYPIKHSMDNVFKAWCHVFYFIWRATVCNVDLSSGLQSWWMGFTLTIVIIVLRHYVPPTCMHCPLIIRCMVGYLSNLLRISIKWVSAVTEVSLRSLPWLRLFLHYAVIQQ